MINCNLRKLLCFTLFAFLGILAVFIIESSAAGPKNEDEISHLRRSVQALNQICRQSSRELEEAEASGKFSVQERHDYQIFIAYLTGRVEKYCQTLYRDGGHEAIAGLNCPRNATATPVLNLPAPQTTAEQVKDLETSLINSLGDFDETLLEEQKRAVARQARQAQRADSGNGGSLSAPGTGSNTSGDENSRESREETGSGQKQHEGKGEKGGQGKTAKESVSAGGGGSNREAISNRPSKRDTLAVDDDIVARQLREAAEKETDPELKKKLWEEYRKYKAGQ
jgi:hypothetical protein